MTNTDLNTLLARGENLHTELAPTFRQKGNEFVLTLPRKLA